MATSQEALVCTGLLLGGSGAHEITSLLGSSDVHDAPSRRPMVRKGLLPDNPSMQRNATSGKTQSAGRARSDS